MERIQSRDAVGPDDRRLDRRCLAGVQTQVRVQHCARPAPPARGTLLAKPPKLIMTFGPKCLETIYDTWLGWEMTGNPGDRG